MFHPGRNAKTGQLDRLGLRLDQDIGRFEVFMHNVLPVNVGQGSG
jgi:hypothetical protein